MHEPLERKDILEEAPTRAKEHERIEEQTNIHTKETTAPNPT